MSSSQLLPRFRGAFESGCRVRTGGGTGRTELKYLADATFPTGHVTLGYPASPPIVNQPLQVTPAIPPGSYPVLASFISKIYDGQRCITFAFVTVVVSEMPDVKWEGIGHFFTDSGDGCIVDTSLESLVREGRSADTKDNWRRIRDATRKDGDGRYELPGTENHAVLFRALDWSYDCYVARDANGNVSKLLIDGRMLRLRDYGLVSALRKVFT